MKYILVVAVLFIFSCKSQKQNKEIDKRLTLLVRDGYFPVDNPETQIIKDSKSLTAFFSKINQTRKPGLPVPEIDFKTHYVLIACMGAVKSDSFPNMFVKKEGPDEITIAVEMPEEKKDFNVESYPFCVYSIVDEGKRLTLEIE